MSIKKFIANTNEPDVLQLGICKLHMKIKKQ